MQGPGIECGLSFGFDAFLLSFSTNRMLLFTISLCLYPPGQNSGISNMVVDHTNGPQTSHADQPKNFYCWPQ